MAITPEQRRKIISDYLSGMHDHITELKHSQDISGEEALYMFEMLNNIGLVIKKEDQ